MYITLCLNGDLSHLWLATAREAPWAAGLRHQHGPRVAHVGHVQRAALLLQQRHGGGGAVVPGAVHALQEAIYQYISLYILYIV